MGKGNKDSVASKVKIQRVSEWLSPTGTCSMGFIMFTKELAQHPAYKSLSYSARLVYQCLALEAAGKPKCILTAKKAEKDYGISENTLRRAIEDLEKAGFIKTCGGGHMYLPNEYTFTYKWRSYGRPEETNAAKGFDLNDNALQVRVLEESRR